MSTRKKSSKEESKSDSDLVRVTAGRSNSLDRLPSLRPKRDLTLGGVPKKTFAPTIPSGRRVKTRVESGGEAVGSEGVRQVRGSCRRGRERKGRDVITSASVFSLGPAEAKRAGRKKEVTETFGGACLSRPKKEEHIGKRVVPPTTEPPDLDDDVIVAQQRVAELFPNTRLPPVQLPLDSPLRELPSDQAGPSHLKQQPTAAELFNPSEPEKGKFLFFQLPDCLPVPLEQEDGHPALRAVPEGVVGKLLVHKSGRVRLVLGDTALNVCMGTSCGFLQELVCVRAEEKRLTILGQLAHRLVCSPDLDAVLARTKTT